MIAEAIRAFTELLKLAPRYMVAIAVIAGTLLFSPISFLTSIGLEQFAQNNRAWIGLSFVVSSVLYGIDRIAKVPAMMRNRFRSAEFKERRLQRLNSLTEDEKQILRFYFAKQTRTNVLRIDDGVVNGLVAAGIIYRFSNYGNPILGFAHNINEEAWEYLNENIHLLEGSTNFYRTDDMRR